MAEVNDIYEVRIFCTHTSQQQTAVNVRHYRIVAKQGTGATDLTIAQFLDTQFHTVYKPILHNQAQYRGVGVRRIKPLPVTAEVLTSGNVGAGTATGEPLPGQVCGIITLRTLFGGPRYRGRMYLPFPAETFNDADSLPTTAYYNLLGTLGNVMASGMSPGAGGNTMDMLPIVFSRKFSTSEDVIGYTQRFKWATQRSRGSYGAKNPAPF